MSLSGRRLQFLQLYLLILSGLKHRLNLLVLKHRLNLLVLFLLLYPLPLSDRRRRYFQSDLRRQLNQCYL